ncbi:unnamed protein product [Fraxinus pennsylvanica]|uniref:GDSL esterase/lipase n=1 Tax=Fraxinus pennsylvanica TaxID=56036 RepID=A0AAD1YRS3_9LAMI|nr:unnamed protein product [Fraxinus pennsylvanica]
MEDYRLKTYNDNRMQIELYYGRPSASPNDFWSYSTPYASSSSYYYVAPPSPLGPTVPPAVLGPPPPKDWKLKKGKSTTKVPTILVFGDSSVDAGNNNQISTVLKSNFRPYGRDFFGGKPTGRFSNGHIPPDFNSEGFGLRPFMPAYLDPMSSNFN